MKRRRFLRIAVPALSSLGALAAPAPARSTAQRPPRLRLFLAGDVMTGRGIDQILPHPGAPEIFEPYLRSALGYVALAEGISGAIPRRVDFSYIWGAALAELDQARPHVRIINLETAVTTAGNAWPGKGIHYRMHPANTPCLSAARIDCCVLANNHTLDWGYRGLDETLASLRAARIGTAGAGTDAASAAAPAAIALAGGAQVLVFAYALPSSGVPPEWAAGAAKAGLSVLPDLSDAALDKVAGDVRGMRRRGDIVVISVHWGANWGYYLAAPMRAFARRLIDVVGADLVHGHSSHHPLGIEVYRDRLILYGCGDLLNDYEGIGGHEAYRPDLALLYLADLEADSGRLLQLDLVPMRIRRFRLERATREGAAWLTATLSREGSAFGTAVLPAADARLRLQWP